MNAPDLLERRAERGTARGAPNVWANAQLEATVHRRTISSKLLLRVALVAWIVGLATAIITQQPDPTRNLDVAQGGEDIPVEVEDDLPPPIVVDGIPLERVHRPFDPDLNGDEIFAEPIANDLDELGTSSVIFADPDAPFDNPVLGLTLFESGGFRPWAANLDGTSIDELTKFVEKQDGTFTIAKDSGLVEVARFPDDPYDSLKFGWQFDFIAGDEETIVQSEPSDPNARIDEWVWVARLGTDRTDTMIRPVQVMGEAGMIVTLGDSSAEPVSENILWTTDGYVHRLTGSTIRQNTAMFRPVAGDISRLAFVEREAWIDSINDAERSSFLGVDDGSFLGLAVVLLLASTLLLVALAVVKLVRSSIDTPQM